MTWVRLTCEQEAVVEVDVPLDAGEDALREAALLVLDASGGAEWDTVGGEVEASTTRPPTHDERLAAEREQRLAIERARAALAVRR